jgi:hypothetical protein
MVREPEAVVSSHDGQTDETSGASDDEGEGDDDYDALDAARAVGKRLGVACRSRAETEKQIIITACT